MCDYLQVPHVYCAFLCVCLQELKYKNLPSFRKCSAKQSKKPSLDVSGGDSVKEPDNSSQWNGPLSGWVSQPKQTSKSNLKFVPRLGPLSLPPSTATLTAAQPLKSGKRGQSNEAPVVIEHSEDEEEKKKNEEMEKRKQDILSPDSNCLLGIKAAGREYLYSTCENQCSSTEHISKNLLGVVDSSPVASPSCTYTSEAHTRDASPPASLLSHSPSPSVVTKSPYFSQSTQGSTSTHTVSLFDADRDSDDDFEHPQQYGYGSSFVLNTCLLCSVCLSVFFFCSQYTPLLPVHILVHVPPVVIIILAVGSFSFFDFLSLTSCVYKCLRLLSPCLSVYCMHMMQISPWFIAFFHSYKRT